jgi:N-methylhydantoinase A
MIQSRSRGLRVGIDIGGTFTDIVAIGDDGRVLVKKASSTPRDYSEGCATGLAELLNENGVDPGEVMTVVHATTMATNAVLEGKGARTGLITTAGFRDVLEFRRVRVPELYNLGYVKPPPLVPRRFRLEVVERMGPGGEIRVALDEGGVRAAAVRLKEASVEAVAICLLHSYANPAHEKRVRAIVEEVFDGAAFITCSHEILPEIREYERTSTTVVNAYLGPVMHAYLGRLEQRLAQLGAARSLHVMTSGGGQMSLSAARTRPAYLVESGPAAGVIAAAHIARRQGLPNVITFDMGGTTAKTAIVENGEAAKTSEFEIGAGINLSSKLVKGAGYAIKLPFVDVSEIGAGGGSQLWFDKGGALKAGPESAGAEPGPVCYGKGGRIATLSDAFLALGYINPEYLVGGALRLQPMEARDAIRWQVADRLERSVEEGAHGAVTVAIANMVRAVKSVSTYRGRDPRDYTLIAFGGNGPLVGAMVARELSMKRVLVPPHPGVLSAYGLLVSDHEQELVRSYPGPVREIDPAALGRSFEELAGQARNALVAEGFSSGEIVVRRFADLRYVGQAFELTVPLPNDRELALADLEDGFHEEHLRTYSHMSRDEPVGLVSIRVIASARAPEHGEADRRRASAPGTPRADGPRHRMAFFGSRHGLIETPVLSRADLSGVERAGPLIIEEYDSTCIAPPSARASVDRWNNIVITLGDEP